MTTKHTAADQIRALANMYQNMVGAAELLEQIGSLENAATEAKKAAEAARDEAEAAKLDADLAKAEKAKAKAAVKALIDKANEDAADIVAGAAEAHDIKVEAAQEKARDIMLSAAAQANEQLAGVAARKAALERDCVTLTEKTEGLALDIKAKTDEVKDLEARLAKAQAQIAKLLG